jgi:hypothetical protein
MPKIKMETAKMSGKFDYAAQQHAIKALEREITGLARQYEDATADDDEYTAAAALVEYAERQARLERLTGANEPQPEISAAQQQFLDRRAALGDDWRAPNRRQDYVQAHIRAVGAGWPIDSVGYFNAVSGHLDQGGDGRQPVLDEQQAAKLCGVTPEEYAQGAAHVRALKARGFYQG